MNEPDAGGAVVAMKTIDGMMLKDMFLSGAALVGRNRASIDALNVFPVPDGDTGTNMSQTLNMAVKDLSARTAPTGPRWPAPWQRVR